MGVGHWLRRVRASEDGLMVDGGGFVIMETGLILDFAERLLNRDDLPESVTLDWLEPQDYDAELERDDCFTPAAVLESLKWLQRVAGENSEENRTFWNDAEASTHRPEGRLEFSPQRLVERLNRELEPMMRLCEEAKKARQRLVHVVVP